TFHLADLSGSLLGWASGREIWIDVDAAGWGWSGGPAPGRMDLAHAVEHELGHVLGFAHENTGVMEAFLAPGVQRLPEALPGTGNVVVFAPSAGNSTVSAGATASGTPAGAFLDAAGTQGNLAGVLGDRAPQAPLSAATVA